MDKKWLENISSQTKHELQQISKINEKTDRFGLTFSEKQIKDLVVREKDTLHEQKRIEFGEGILPRLIYEFCDSAYISQDNYFETMSKLQEIFYFYKNESMDQMSDDELLCCMKEAFEGECKGSLEYLEDTVLEKIARNLRANGKDGIHHTGIVDFDENTIEYSPEEIYSVALGLLKKYTSNESSSVPIETAQQLVSAVIYCIELLHQTDHNEIVTKRKISVNEAYQLGYNRIVEKMKETQSKYNRMILEFDAYENENYYETVTKAIPGFFRYYDPKFAPQDTIITMDYPTIQPITHQSGIMAIAKYVDYISTEQQFLSVFPAEYIDAVLYKFQKNYRIQYYNICQIIERHVLANLLLYKDKGSLKEDMDYEALQAIIIQYDVNALMERLYSLLQMMVNEQFQNNSEMQQYLGYDCKDFAVELINASKYNKLDKVVV